jgi:NADH-quinone oxidoreductase subunit C
MTVENPPEPTEPVVPDSPAPVAVAGGMWSDGSPDVSGYGGLSRFSQVVPTASRPYGGWYDAVVDRLAELVSDPIARVVIDRGEMTWFVSRDKLAEVVKALRDDALLRFEVCASVSGVHYPSDEGAELHAVHHLQSMTHNRRLRLEVTCPESDPHVPSVVPTYPAADWHEREAWDMFGIVFDGHPHLTRILMPDDWVGHPQRKDYPLGGIPVEYKGAVVPAPDERRQYR